MMRIRVDEIPEAGRFLHLAWAETHFQRFLPPGDPLTFGLDRPLSIDLEVHKKPDHVLVQGSIRTTFQLDCHRCLERFAWELEQPVEVLLLYQQKSPGQADAEDLELTGEELDQTFFDGEEIDIDALVAEQVLLALPLKALCSDGCKGICPRCGVNLNVESCRCADSQQPSPFAVLRTIREQLPDRTSS